MVEVYAVFCYFLLWIDNTCMYMTHVWFHVCCSDCGRVFGNVCCVEVIVFLALEC